MDAAGSNRSSRTRRRPKGDIFGWATRPGRACATRGRAVVAYAGWGRLGSVFGESSMSVLVRQLLRERTPDLIAEACAWSVGLSDQQHYARRHGRLSPTGQTIGVRAAAELA